MARLEQQRAEEVQRLWHNSEHPVTIAKRLYDHSLKTGVHCSISDVQERLVNGLYEKLCSQQEEFARCRQIQEESKRSRQAKVLKQFQFDPTIAIKLFLAR